MRLIQSAAGDFMHEFADTSTQSTADDPPAALIFGFTVGEDGAVTELDWSALQLLDLSKPKQWCWIHLNRLSEETAGWLNLLVNPDAWVLNALLQDDTRPRIVPHSNGYLLNLRGVNLNPGASPEDMISIRMWATKRYAITTRSNRILAAEDIRDQMRAGKGPSSSGALIASIARRLVSPMGHVVANLDEQVDELEDTLLNRASPASKTRISSFRRMVLTLRRYLAPQREAIASFTRDETDFLSTEDKHFLRDTQDTLTRLTEDLDLIRERALLLQEQLVEERAEEMNERLFVLAVLSAIFLPLSFVTGLFGVNVGGMPGVSSQFAFAILCVFILVVAIFILWYFRRKKWI
jgi:zinc transporter